MHSFTIDCPASQVAKLFEHWKAVDQDLKCIDSQAWRIIDVKTFQQASGINHIDSRSQIQVGETGTSVAMEMFQPWAMF